LTARAAAAGAADYAVGRLVRCAAGGGAGGTGGEVPRPSLRIVGGEGGGGIAFAATQGDCKGSAFTASLTVENTGPSELESIAVALEGFPSGVALRTEPAALRLAAGASG